MFNDEFIAALAETLAPLIASKMAIRPAVEKRLLTPAEAAVHLGCSENAIRIRMSRKLVPVVKQAGCPTMLDIKDLNKWIENGKQNQ